MANGLGIGPKGVAFPFQKREDGFPAPAEAPEIYVASVKQILLTTIGERVMRPGFGSQLKFLLFSPISVETEGRIRAEITRAIRANDSRIDVDDVTFESDDSTITVKITLVTPQAPAFLTIELPKIT